MEYHNNYLEYMVHRNEWNVVSLNRYSAVPGTFGSPHVYSTWGTTKVFSSVLMLNIQKLILMYFFKVLSFSINAFVHSDKSVFEAVLEVFFLWDRQWLVLRLLTLRCRRRTDFHAVDFWVLGIRKSRRGLNLENMEDLDMILHGFQLKIHW